MSASPYAGISAALADWGAGGLLSDLEAVIQEHGPNDVPPRVHRLVHALSLVVSDYAFTGGINTPAILRTAPCPVCAAAWRVQLEAARATKDSDG